MSAPRERVRYQAGESRMGRGLHTRPPVPLRPKLGGTVAQETRDAFSREAATRGVTIGALFDQIARELGWVDPEGADS